MNKVVVKILGSEYNIVGKNPDQMKNVARYVDGEMNKVKEANSKLSSLTTAIVTCLNILLMNYLIVVMKMKNFIRK